MSTKTLLIAGIVAVVVIVAAAVLVLNMDEKETHISEGVIYDGNGGKTSDGKSTMDSKLTEVLPGSLFTKDGAQFDSWNTKKDGSGTTYKPGDQISYGSKTVTLYAIWYDGKNLTTFALSYSYFSLVYDGQALGKVDSVKLPSSGSIVITVQPILTGGQAVINGDLVDYRIIDGTKVASNKGSFTIEGDTGHTFSVDGGVIKLKITYDGSKDVSLTYNESSSSFSKGIHYSGNDGKTAEGKSSFAEDSNTVSANKFTLEGKTFVSWNTKKDGSGTTYKPGDKVDYYGYLLLYAQWV